MRRLLLIAASFAALAAAAPLAAQEAAPCIGDIDVRAPVPVWQGTPPGMDGWGGILDHPVEESATEDGDHLFNVTRPTLEAFLPDPACATGAAVMVAPGGGFRLLAIENEGRLVARWLAQHGIAAFVLKYRLVQYDNPSLEQPVRRVLPDEVPSQAAIADGFEALRLIRDQAEDYGIDPERTGAIGFSAGGHLVLSLGLDPDETRRPDFIGNIYGTFFYKQFPELPPANLPFPPGTPEEIWLQPAPTPAPGALPPIFMAMAQDDRAVVLGFDQLAEALKDAGYRPETHLYLKGGHGFGIRPRGLTTDHFIDQFYDWMRVIGMLTPTPAQSTDGQ